MGRARRNQVRSCSLTRLGAELSAVINRVRRAFGPVSMADYAGRPEILQAERQVARVAWQVVRGQQQPEVWQQVLAHYEACWMQLLGTCRASRAA
ncbi:MAG: hypothetical protein HYW07_04525 [Candidatus Latescibacteria bacterium]|nr:hypothetical protein [Candidatus Latescibacterota bacterium]